MAITDNCQASFSTQIRERGNRYFREGRVKLLGMNERACVFAEVVGSAGEAYEVVVDLSEVERGDIYVACDCPYAEENLTCKHIWGTFQAIKQSTTAWPWAPDEIFDVYFLADLFEEFAKFVEKAGEDRSSDWDDENWDDGDWDDGRLNGGGVDLLTTAELDKIGPPPTTKGEYHELWMTFAVSSAELAERAFMNQLAELVKKADEQELGWLQRCEEVFQERQAASRDLIPLSPDQLPFGDFVQQSVQRAKAPSFPGLDDHWQSRRQERYRCWFLIQVGRSQTRGDLTLTICEQSEQSEGTWSDPFPVSDLSVATAERVADPADRQLLQMLLGASASKRLETEQLAHRRSAEVVLPAELYEQVLPRFSEPGRCGWLLESGVPIREAEPVRYVADAGWEFRLQVEDDEEQQRWLLSAWLQRGDQRIRFSEPAMLLPSGLLIHQGELSLARLHGTEPWLQMWRTYQQVPAGYPERAAVLKFLAGFDPRVIESLPESLSHERVFLQPVPVLRFVERHLTMSSGLPVRLVFEYDGIPIEARERVAGCVDDEGQRFLERDREAESAAVRKLAALGFLRAHPSEQQQLDFTLAEHRFDEILRSLYEQGWVLERDGKAIKPSGSLSVSVKSGIDWFDLDVAAKFGDQEAGLPELLQAVRGQTNVVRLQDGSEGTLPAGWEAQLKKLLDLGEEQDDGIQFRPSQALLIDSLLASATDVAVDYDRTFKNFRKRLKQFRGIKPKQPPKQFQGELREYQQIGLGWLDFLRKYQLGGCLADDMGLGKTIQILAHLAARRKRPVKKGEARCPSLIVVPKSLVFNWMSEAARFVPNLKMLDYTGPERTARWEEQPNAEVLVTTYATLRIDIEKLAGVEWDYVILDEAQAIKNAAAQTARAARSLRAAHRLALTGTPVENHLGELWSLFEFLNPGMLGSSAAFKRLTSSRPGEAHSLEEVRDAVAPFLLRRTKAQVLTELPEKSEHILMCELDAKQRRLYDELRDHYRAGLAQKIKQTGLKRAKIQVLEALLRLRQAACHPGLIDAKRKKHSSAKFDALLEQLEELQQEGHKALIFSQFTTLLKLVGERLEKRKWRYEYLDGQTQDRGEIVKRFQESDESNLFLISLKAGGHGLNLTAADYVFLLDPWWNPAVEAQAIDRVHRLGQTRSVFAYRLIAKDTVEEHILELQAQKRELAEAIVSSNESLLRQLTADDLEKLLS